MRWIIPIVLLLLCTGQLYAVEYFVGGAGASDNNPGTASQPFATIQKAASVASAGDVVTIRSGTYRETIVPANGGAPGNPIIFRAAPGARAIISGLNTAEGGWSVHKGGIYKKSINLPVNGYNLDIKNNTTLLANQVFKDGVMMFEARWPKLNNVDDLLDRSKLRARSNSVVISGTSTTDSEIPNIPGGWVGGTIWIQGWYVTNTRTITSHSGGRVGYNNVGANDKYRRYYYLTGKLAALTQEKEWHYESGTLYFWQPGGGPPTGVEYKARNYGFDLSNKPYITIEGLEFFGCTPMHGNTNSRNVIIDGIRAKYMNHAVLQQDPDLIYHNAKQTGIKLIGENSIIRNSELQWAASQAVWLGEKCIAENNLITDISYEGNYGAGITLWDRSGNQIIRYNTIARTGRSGIDFGYVSFGNHLNVDVGYNDIYHFGMLNVDLGGIYGARMTNLAGTRIHHNWIHDSKATNDHESLQLGINTGIYFDQASGPSTCDHNVLWNNVQSDIYTQPTYGGRSTGISRYVNNTLITNAGNGGNRHSYKSSVPSPIDLQRNNIYSDDIIVALNRVKPDVGNSLLHNNARQFDGSGKGGLVYRLKAGSPGINSGVVIKGLTDDAIGAPDIGAYEFGGTEWVPGYTPKKLPQTAPPANALPAVALTSPAMDNTFTVGDPIVIEAKATDANGTIKKVEFYQGNVKLGEDATSPYSFSWANATQGTYSITAKATDNDNGQTTSAAVTITVKANNAPEVKITSPTNNSSFASGTSVSITAAATAPDGRIVKVEFFNGTTKLGEVSNSPYTFVWQGPTAGRKSITAKATDNTNQVAVSSVIQIIIGANAIPVVSITAPQNNAKVPAGNSLTISANATDANGAIQKVEFFNGSQKLGEDLTQPYTFVWDNVPAGSHSLTAKATDNQNAVATSSVIQVTGIADSPPVVSITAPGNNARISAGSSVTISAKASDTNGSIKKVEFFSGAQKLGEDLTEPYSFVWDKVPAGNHSLTAKATDNQNNVVTSSAVQITSIADSPPVVSITAPGNNARISAGSSLTISAKASDTNGSIEKVEFFSGAQKLGEDLTEPYSFVWDKVPAGNHSLTAKATDNQNNVVTSSAVQITSIADSPPVVLITAPLNNAKIPAGSSLTISAKASDVNGSIKKVEFFNGARKLGEDLTEPYTFVWNNVPAGGHTLTAKATDNQNSVATSTVVKITAGSNTPPLVNITNPLNHASFEPGATIVIEATASDENGSVTKVEFFNGSHKLGEDLTAPYSFTWTEVPEGNYVISAQAQDNENSISTSTAVTINVGNGGPEVFITGPADTDVFSAGDEITFIAEATDPNGAIQKIEFYNGEIKIGEDDSAPYELTISNLNSGTHAITAMAINTSGATGFSEPVIVTINDLSLPGPGVANDLQSAIPRFFSPNDDGLGDYWEWGQLELFQNAQVAVFNRSGQKIYEATSYQNDWDGKVNGQPLQPGDYYYIVKMSDLTDLKGSVRIIR